MTMLTEGMTSSASTEWGTPDDLFRPAHTLWDFTLDGAASLGEPEWAVRPNARVERFCTAQGTYGPGALWVRSDLRELVLPAGEEPTGPHGREPGWRFVEHRTVQIDPRDGLRFPWSGERVFLNPPWGDPEQPCGDPCEKKRCAARGWHATSYIPGIEDFLRKAVHSWFREGAKVLAIIPARTDTAWFHEWVLPYARLRFHRGRPHFIDPLTGQAGRQPPVGIIRAEYR